MPQNNPMTPEAFVSQFAMWMPWGKRVLAELIAERDAQLIHSTLEAAAERAKVWLDGIGIPENPVFVELRNKQKMDLAEAILELLTKPATFPAHENDGQTA